MYLIFFRRIPEMRPEDLQIPDGKGDRDTRLAIVGRYALPAAAMFVSQGDFSVKGAVKAAVKGAAINGISIGMEAVGGNITNAFGHMGDPRESKLRKALTSARYKVQLKPDGTYTTNTIGNGPLGRMLSWLTFDEVGGQQEHHLHPEKIAYTSAEGAHSWLDAPWGMTLKKLAESNYFPLINPGEGFGDQRPDVPSEAVLLIKELRDEQYARTHTIYDAAAA